MELNRLLRRASKGDDRDTLQECLIQESFQSTMQLFRAAAPGCLLIANGKMQVVYGNTWDDKSMHEHCELMGISEDEYIAGVQSRGGHYAWCRWQVDVPSNIALVEELAKPFQRQPNGLLNHTYF